VPHKLREKAKKRSEHLGLSGLDVDAAQDEKDESGLLAQIPKSLRRPKQTVSSMLGRDLKGNKFRLDAVTADFLEPVDEMLGGKKWLISDFPSSADCLAMACLVLMKATKETPRPCLSDVLQTKYPEVDGWVQEKQALCFGPPVEGSQRTPELGSSSLPWRSPEPRTWAGVLNAVALNVADATPWLGPLLGKGEVKVDYNSLSRAQSSSLTKWNQKQLAIARIRDVQLLYSQLFGSSVCVVIATGLLFWNGILVLPKRASGPRARNFGEAGAVLGLG
jgi:sorting and assembly machinery component 37